MTFLLRAAVEPLALAGDVRAVLQDMDRAQPITAIAAMEQIVGDSVARPRFLTTLLSGIALLALLLAALGVYGVIAQQTARRTTELGIRTALGARRATLLSCRISIQLDPRQIFEIPVVESPQARLLLQRHRRKSDVDLATPSARNAPVELGRTRGLTGSERQRLHRREERLLRGELLPEPGTAQPLVEDERGEADPMAALDCAT
jgi:hypothetical protein